MSPQDIVDPEEAYENCIYDQCAYDGNVTQMQRVIASYVETCLEVDDATRDDDDDEAFDCEGYNEKKRLHPDNWRLQSNISKLFSGRRIICKAVSEK